MTTADSSKQPVRIVARVEGDPKTKGSTRAFVAPRTGRVIVKSDAKGLKPWEVRIALAARQAMAAAGIRPSKGAPAIPAGPVRLSLTFFLSRPRAHFINGDGVRVRPTRRGDTPATYPDLDKLVRAVGDALRRAWVYRDDGQVVETLAVKQYANPPALPGVAIVVEEVG